MTQLDTRTPVRREDVTEDDLLMLAVVREVKAQESRADYKKVLHALIREGLDLTEPAAVAQARAQATVRNKLLATPLYSHKSLAAVRDEKENATRTTVGRWVNARKAFTITVNGRTVIPAFQLTDEGTPREDLAPLLDPLMAAGLNGWQLWSWLVEPTGMLSGLVPADAAADPKTASRAAKAAARLAARVTPQSPAA
jgi:hypothetical protein